MRGDGEKRPYLMSSSKIDIQGFSRSVHHVRIIDQCLTYVLTDKYESPVN